MRYAPEWLYRARACRSGACYTRHMSKLKAVCWPVEVPKDLALRTELGVDRVVIRSIAGKRRVKFEDSRQRFLMELHGYDTREDLEEHIHRSRRRELELEELRAHGAEPDTASSDDEDDSPKDEQRARSFPTAETLSTMVQRIVYEDGTEDSTNVGEELAECIDYDSETWLCLQCLLRNKLIEETDDERGNASKPSSDT